MVRVLAVVVVLVTAGCSGPDGCAVGEVQCNGNSLEQCRLGGWVELADCVQLGREHHQALVCGYSPGNVWNPPGDNCVPAAPHP